MKKTKPIQLDADLARTFVWMSTRYSVGGHTIATCTHADDLAKFLNDNKAQLIPTDEQRLYYALDIRREISHHLHFRRNVNVDGHNNHMDALTLILRKMVEDKITDFDGYRWDVNLYTCEVRCRELTADERTSVGGWCMDFYDLMPWVKLAGWLDPTEMITVEYEGKTDTKPGFSYFTIRGNGIEELHQWADDYIKRPYNDSFITPDYIRDIKKLYQ